MLSDEQLNEKILEVSTNFNGQLDDLYQIVGMIVVGRLFGWRVMRLVVPRRLWGMSIKLFGDPKLLMKERGVLAYKSFGLKLVDEIGDYWSVVKGKIHTSSQDRKRV